jgi:Zn finger protein HypA/HybF involved in hydrogenase expression
VRKSHLISDEEFVQIASNALSIAQALHQMGLAPKGGNYSSFKRRAKRLGVKLPDPKIAQGWSKGKIVGPKRPIEEYLVKGRHCSSHTLRLRLISEGIKEARCEECGITEWNDLPAPLELEHVNGDHDDNRLENLKILCPNCHAQTETYRGKNKTSKKTKTERLKKEKEVKPPYDHNALKKDEVEERLKKISHIDLGKFGWVQKVADALNLTHTQARRFIKKYYSGEVYTRNSPSK